MDYKVIITGSTGMVGKGVLLECLDSHSISEVLVINRSPLDLKHEKLKEIILKDFSKVEEVQDQLKGYDACFYCMGVSAFGMSEEKYSAITFDITKQFADVLFDLNPKMVFNYISGMGTDSTESKGQMWMRVKGKTENYILNKGFRNAVMFRPGIILAERGIRSKTTMYEVAYTILRPFFPLIKKLPSVTTTTKIGQAMIASITSSNMPSHLENKEINELSDQVVI